MSTVTRPCIEMSQESFSLEVMEQEVMEFLSDLSAEGLEEACNKIDLQVPPSKKGKKVLLLKLVYKHLLPLEELDDGGYETYAILHKFLKDVLGEDRRDNDVRQDSRTDEETVVESSFVHPNDTLDPNQLSHVHPQDPLPNVQLSNMMSNTRRSNMMPNNNMSTRPRGAAQVSKLPTLKITGVIGGKKEGSISYTNLKFQIKNAEQLDYPEQSICGAVIKAIDPGNELRAYFETKPELKLKEMLDFLQPVFSEQQDSSAYFSELCNSAQKGGQNCMNFVVGLLSLKQKILDLSEAEGNPFDRNLMAKQFQKTLFSGIKNTNIRAEVRENCKSWRNSRLGRNVDDSELVRIVAEAMANETERANKFALKKDVSQVGASTAGEDEPTPAKKPNKNKENLLPAQFDQQKQDMQALRAEFNELKASNVELKSLLTANVNFLAAQNNPPRSSATPSAPPYNPNAPPQNPGAQPYNPGAPPYNPGAPPYNAGTPPFNAGAPPRNNNWRVRKCSNCIQNNVPRCTHCWTCCDPDHKNPECPRRQQQRQGNE